MDLVGYCIMRLVGRLRSERGESIVEYLLIVGLVALAVVVFFSLIGGKLK